MGYEVEFHEKSLIFHFGEGIVLKITKYIGLHYDKNRRYKMD